MKLSQVTNPTTSLIDYTEKLQRAFNYYGFVTPPLSTAQLHLCHAEGFSENTTYNLACDVAGGFFETMQEAIAYYHAPEYQ